MKIILALALFVYACLAASNCPATISSTFFNAQTFLAVPPTNFANKDIVVRDFANGHGYINILNRLIGAYGYNIKGVKGPNTVDATVDAVAFVMNILTEVSLQWYFAEASVDIDFKDGNVSLAGAAAAFLGVATRAFGIVEFEDTNNIPGFQVGDNILGGYDLANIYLGQWCDIEAKVTPVTDANGVTFNVRSAAAITQDNVFGFRVTSIGRYAQIDGVNVDPNTIKIDFVINYFNNPYFAAANWVKGYGAGPVPSDGTAHPNSSVALVTGFAAVAAAGAVGVAKTITTDPNGNSQTGIGYGVAAGAVGEAAALYSYFTYKQEALVQVVGVAGAKAAAVILAKGSATDPTGNGFWNIKTALTAGGYAKWGTVDLAIFSFDCPRPTQVYMDPSTGGTSPSNFAGTYSSAFFLMAIFAILFALF